MTQALSFSLRFYANINVTSQALATDVFKHVKTTEIK
jgi:hypothetical protein